MAASSRIHEKAEVRKVTARQAAALGLKPFFCLMNLPARHQEMASERTAAGIPPPPDDALGNGHRNDHTAPAMPPFFGDWNARDYAR
jgi:hypothetical protein